MIQTWVPITYIQDFSSYNISRKMTISHMCEFCVTKLIFLQVINIFHTDHLDHINTKHHFE